MVAVMFSKAVSDKKIINIIDHKFLITGHTHMECDSDHATIERVKKCTRTIKTPVQLYELVKYAAKVKPFNV